MSSRSLLLLAALLVAWLAGGTVGSSTLRAEEDDVARALGKFREQVAKAEGISFVGRLRERSGGRAIQRLGSYELTFLGAAAIRAEGKRLEVRDFRLEAVGEAGRVLALYDGEKLRVADFTGKVVRAGEADWKTLLGHDFGDVFLAVAGLPRDDRTLQIERVGMRTIGVQRMLRFDAWLETQEQTAERLRKKPFVLRPHAPTNDADLGAVAPEEIYSGPAKVLTVGLDPETGDLYRLDLRESLGRTPEGEESVRIVTLAFDPFRLLTEAPKDRLTFEIPEKYPQQSADWSHWSWDQAIPTETPPPAAETEPAAP